MIWCVEKNKLQNKKMKLLKGEKNLFNISGHFFKKRKKIADDFECFNKFVELDNFFGWKHTLTSPSLKNVLTYVLQTKSNIKEWNGKSCCSNCCISKFKQLFFSKNSLWGPKCRLTFKAIPLKTKYPFWRTPDSQIQIMVSGYWWYWYMCKVRHLLYCNIKPSSRAFTHLGLFCESLEPNHPLRLPSRGTETWLCSGLAGRESLLPLENKVFLSFFPLSTTSTGPAACTGFPSGVAAPWVWLWAPSISPSSFLVFSMDQRLPSLFCESSPRRVRFWRERERGAHFSSRESLAGMVLGLLGLAGSDE